MIFGWEIKYLNIWLALTFFFLQSLILKLILTRKDKGTRGSYLTFGYNHTIEMTSVSTEDVAVKCWNKPKTLDRNPPDLAQN